MSGNRFVRAAIGLPTVQPAYLNPREAVKYADLRELQLKTTHSNRACIRNDFTGRFRDNI